jgi:uncharacterized tellurite resistance protein B-like protein
MSFLESLFETLRGGSPRMQEAGIDETETVRKIARALDELDTERARYVATFAYILGRVAHADLDVSEEETQAMERIVAERGGLPIQQAVIAVQIAKSQNKLFGGTEDFLVTREFNDIASYDQKVQLLDCLFAVSACDDEVSTIEDNEIGKITRELRLGREELVRARQGYIEQLGVLKRPEEASPDASS